MPLRMLLVKPINVAASNVAVLHDLLLLSVFAH